MPFRRTARYLLAATLALFVLPSTEARAWRAPVAEIPPGTDLSPSILFQASIPLEGFDPRRPSEARRKELAAFATRLAAEPSAFVVLQLRLDPVGVPAEQARWAADFLQIAAARLREAGVPRDRLVLLPPERDASWLDAFPWKEVETAQLLRIRLLRGGDWLRRKASVEAPPPQAPLPPGGIFILEPAEGKTDRSFHMLKGAVEGDVRTVAVAVNRETQAASVFAGVLEIPISLRAGENRITLSAVDSYGRPFSATRIVLYAPPRPTIEIVEPAPGSRADITRSPAITLRGRVKSKTPVKEVFLEQNGIPHPIPVSPDGSFERKAVLVTEEDSFRVEAVDTAGERGVSEVRTVASTTVAERPLLVFLHWDRDDVDLDLHVSDGKGHDSSYEAPDTFADPSAVPNARFWIDDRNGFGPEAFSVEDSSPGSYRISVTYFRGKNRCRAWLTVVLFSGTPSRRTVRTIGPVDLSPAVPRLELAEVTLPAGEIRQDIAPIERKNP
jgi:hypothetical protein